MGARVRPLHPIKVEQIRQKIRAGMLVDRLEKHAFGDSILDPSQVSAALGLLKKCVPDLTATELTGAVELKSRLTIVNG